MIRTTCPRCDETDYKKNGKTHHGKQNYRCRRCGREFIQELERQPVTLEQQALVKKRVAPVSLLDCHKSYG